ncbi:MAG TPA: hypothetical protein VMU09_05310 [Acidimicrobiales bacterium]|nr:hypothetical protein [Acidimicrobiales bacterium]
MNQRTWYVLAAIGAVLGGAWWVKRKQTSAGTPTAAATPAFSQAQEVQDFQIFSALTSAQQGSDLNFVGQMLSLFSGGGAQAAPSQVGTGGTTSPAIPSGANPSSVAVSPGTGGALTGPGGQSYVPLTGAQGQGLSQAETYLAQGLPAYYESATGVLSPVPTYAQNPQYGPWVGPNVPIYVPT